MNKYRVVAHVTICVEKEIKASCRDEAVMEFALLVDKEYGWADYDTVNIEEVEND